MALSRVVFSSDKDDWGTPTALFQEWDARYHFTLDPCTSPDNPLGTPRFYTKADNGLAQSWAGERVFMNPPYGKRPKGERVKGEPSQIATWMRKARDEAKKPGTVVVCLVPSRTSEKWWWDTVMTVWPHGVHFIKGRVKFVGAKSGAPFPSVIVVFGGAVGARGAAVTPVVQLRLE